MDKEKTNFKKSGHSFIIIRKLTKEIIDEAVTAYAEKNVYWLKLYHFDVDRNVFNK